MGGICYYICTMKDVILEAKRPQKEYWKDLYRHRELFYFFAWRDVIVRYKQAFFGIAWALIRPLLTMLLFTFIFSRLAGLPSEGIPYYLFALAGLTPWLLFANVLTETTLSLLNNPNLISRVYFPRMIIPSSQIIVQFVDFSISMVLLFALILYSGIYNGLTLLFLPLFIVQLLALCLGCALFLSSITVKWRDVRYLVPFFVQFGMYVSPVGYGSFMIPESYHWIYFLNPMAGIIEGFRWSIFGTAIPDLSLAIGESLVVTALIVMLGVLYFRKSESQFGDII